MKSMRHEPRSRFGPARIGHGLTALALGLIACSLAAPAKTRPTQTAPAEAGPTEAGLDAVSSRTPDVTREGIWRAIFARPAPGEGQHGLSPERVELGRDLFSDVRLSGSRQASCVTCHNPAQAFTDGRKTAVGPGGAVLTRNAPSLYNLAWGTSFFWDGRAATLADQARFPILAVDELAADFPTIAGRLSADPEMKARFAAAFPEHAGRVTEDAILEALVAYERSLVSPITRFDQWVEGDEKALSPEESQGFDIFVGKGGCVSCHGGWRLTDDGFHDVGLPGGDLGRGAIMEGTPRLPQFKTPSLREAARTAPYMHDGSLATLEDVVEHYAGHLIERPSLAPTIVRHLVLSAAEKAALVAFLKTLSSEQIGHASDGTSRPMLKK
jgi:cytochrome c peroxidase